MPQGLKGRQWAAKLLPLGQIYAGDIQCRGQQTGGFRRQTDPPAGKEFGWRDVYRPDFSRATEQRRHRISK